MSCLTTQPQCTAAVQLLHSWDSFEDRDRYVLYHFLNPFLLYTVSQNFWFSFLVVYLWESFETFEVAVCGGTFCISGGGIAPRCSELQGFITDNLLGDTSQGLVGILTAMLFRIVLEIPDWSPSFRSLFSTTPSAVHIWFKRILFYVALFSSTLVGSFLDVKITYGVHAAYLLGVFAIFAGWNQTRCERNAFWTWPGSNLFNTRLYWTVYGTLALWTAAMVVLVGYVPLGTSYQTFYFFIGLTWLGLVVAANWLGRFAQLIDFMTLGYFSIRTGMSEHRFLYNKKRMQNLPALLESRLNNS